MRLVVEPPRSAPVARVRDVAGVAVYVDWLTAGRIRHVEPTGRVSWGLVSASSGAGDVAVVGTGVEPAKLEVRFFAALSHQIPVGNGTVVACTAALGAPCRYVLTHSSMRVSFTPLAGTQAFVVDGQWYVPEKDRRAIAGASAFDSVSWAFRYR